MSALFDLTGKVVAISGAAGLLGRKHAEAIASAGGIPVLLDLHQRDIDKLAGQIKDTYGVSALGVELDITNEELVSKACGEILSRFGKVDVLINNAANNPKVDASNTVVNATRLENFPLEIWLKDIAVGLTGAFLCSKYFGSEMAKAGAGVIVNISSDLGVIAPDQRIYRQNGVDENMQNVKPVTYSVVKTGLIGLTRYLATYWKGVRCNALCPGGVFNGQGEDFVQRVSSLIPIGRMANVDEYQGAILFLSSDASSYMNGAVLVMDGGRSCW